jgi:hypothetical protein
VLHGGGTDIGVKSSDVNCTSADSVIAKDISLDLSSSAIRDSNSAPRYQYHGLAATQTQSQHYGDFEEMQGSQKENINGPNASVEVKSMAPPATNVRPKSPHASSSLVKDQAQVRQTKHSPCATSKKVRLK